jgi:hypothetical protein
MQNGATSVKIENKAALREFPIVKGKNRTAERTKAVVYQAILYYMKNSQADAGAKRERA